MIFEVLQHHLHRTCPHLLETNGGSLRALREGDLVQWSRLAAGKILKRLNDEGKTDNFTFLTDVEVKVHLSLGHGSDIAEEAGIQGVVLVILGEVTDVTLVATALAATHLKGGLVLEVGGKHVHHRETRRSVSDKNPTIG